jgi:hypothetical protein
MTDAQWKEICDWLTFHGLVLHIPIKGPAYLTDKITGRYVRNW